jgi:hypothetical protein
MRIFFSFFLLCSLTNTALAGDLKIKMVDYGTPDDPAMNPILPGQAGDIFLTFQNPTNVAYRDVELSPYIGDCVDSFSTTLRIPEIPANSTMRWSEPLQIKLSPFCAREAPGGFLLLGEHTAIDGQKQRIWAEGKFPVAPFPEVNFVADNLNLTIPDQQAVEHEFEVRSNMTIRQVGVNVVLQHSSHRDLVIYLQHPSGRRIALFNKSGGSGLMDLKLGLGGNPLNELQQLVGLSATGKWKVIVSDEARVDTGLLTKVGLRLK